MKNKSIVKMFPGVVWDDQDKMYSVKIYDKKKLVHTAYYYSFIDAVISSYGVQLQNFGENAIPASIKEKYKQIVRV